MDYVERMAKEKARAALDFYTDKPGGKESQRDVVILAADTTVILGKRILGKPKDFDDFFQMMSALSGQGHQVFTAVSAIKKSDHEVLEESVLNENLVLFDHITESEINWYWQTGEPLDKAGGYGIQGQGARFVRSITGSYSGVVGLPLYETTKILTNFGIESI